ncbi:MAG TPA: hypothetical protein VJ276_13820 [Thermoanaerobaculia bacterium]|nr:hypothetical protein [Thermoanaerobaculia bacterium]
MGNSTPTPSSKRPQSIEEFELKYTANCRSSHNQKRLKEGICHGMCLDWVRSMIRDSGARFVDYHSMDIGQLRKVYAVEARMHQAYNVVGDKLMKASLARQKELLDQAERKNQKARRLQQHGMELLRTIDETELRLGEKLSESERTVLSINSRAMWRDIGRINSYVDETSQFAKTTELQVQRLNEVFHDDERMFHHFYSYFRDHLHEWVEKGDEFSDIIAGTGEYESLHPKALDDWFSKIRACLFQLQSKQCALLNFRRSSDDKKDPGAGHYVAFARVDSIYHLFDPNVGWYQVDGLSEMMEMFKDLWSAGYVNGRYSKSIWRVFYSGALVMWVNPRLPSVQSLKM